MAEVGTHERVLKRFSSGADAKKTHEEIMEYLADKDLSQPTVEVSI